MRANNKIVTVVYRPNRSSLLMLLLAFSNAKTPWFQAFCSAIFIVFELSAAFSFSVVLLQQFWNWGKLAFVDCTSRVSNDSSEGVPCSAFLSIKGWSFPLNSSMLVYPWFFITVHSSFSILAKHCGPSCQKQVPVCFREPSVSVTYFSQWYASESTHTYIYTFSYVAVMAVAAVLELMNWAKGNQWQRRGLIQFYFAVEWLTTDRHVVVKRVIMYYVLYLLTYLNGVSTTENEFECI